MHAATFAFIALFLLLFGLVSARLEKTWITAPMAFVLCGFLIGPEMFHLIETDVQSEVVKILIELTLVLVLFTDASGIRLSTLKKQFTLPLRLLSISLPLTIGLGTLIGMYFFPHFNIWAAALLATALAPTDAALGIAVMKNTEIPLRMRQTMNVESGLNDGLAVPILLFFLAVCSMTSQGNGALYWLQFGVMQLILGPLVGICIGYVCSALVVAAHKKKWISHAFEQLAAIAIALLAFSTAEMIGGNGLMAAFCAGLTVGNVASNKVCNCLYEFAEAEGELLLLLSFLVFGSIMAWPALIQVDASILLYSILSLTLIRMIPTSLALIGSKLSPASHVFLGWFGPRGIASIAFGLLILDHTFVDVREEIFAIVMTTVFLSVFLHGMTSVPFSHWYAKTLKKTRKQAEMEEFQEVEAIRLAEHNKIVRDLIR